jgi:hypothetical protein
MSDGAILATASRERALDGTCWLLKKGTFTGDDFGGASTGSLSSSAHEEKQEQKDKINR